MLNLSQIFGDLFCITILATLISGMISDQESEEKNAFLALIFTAMCYITSCIIWQLVESGMIIKTYRIIITHAVLSRVLIVELMHASLRYLYLVITGRTPPGVTCWLPVFAVLGLSVASVWTGWFFQVGNNLVVTPGPYRWVEYVLTYSFLLVSTVLSLYKTHTHTDAAVRRRSLIAACYVIPLLLVSWVQWLNPSLRANSFGIVLSICLVFVRLQKISVNESFHKLRIQRENATRYRNTVLSTALQFMVVDLTKDTILELSVPRKPEITTESLIRSGRLRSLRYTDTVRMWNENVVGLSQQEMDRLFLPAALLERYSRGETQLSDTLQIRLASGRVAWCRQDLIMARNSQTRNVIATLTVYDITEQKIKEQNYDIQRQIIESLASGVSAYWILDWETEEVLGHQTENERIRFFSDKILAQGSYTAALDYIYGNLVDENSRQQALSYVRVEVVRSKLKKQQSYTVPMYLAAQGSFFQITFNRIFVGDRKAFIVAAREITDMVSRERDLRRELGEALDAAREASKAKTDFLLNMSHDIRTPMNAILGFQELAKRNVGDPQKVTDALEKSRRSGEHLLNLINDILDMSRIESGKIVLTTEVIQIQEHISRFEDMFRIPMEEKGLTFRVINKTRTAYVRGDYLRLTQVVTNLLSNAMKFTPAGGTVTFLAEELLEQHNGEAFFRITIRDTGIGMSDEFQKKLFEAFEREHSSTVSGVQGTGLGLAISRKLALLMDAQLTCTSRLGEGTEFVFSFRLPVAESGAEIQKAEPVDLSGKKVLLVEDNELNREIAREILTGDGLLVTEVSNGAQAVDLLSRASAGDFDVVLMDIQMPVMDGYTATQLIRTMVNPAIATLPIIAMTADAFAEDKQRALDAGMTDHIAKPVSMDRLTQTLSQYIGTK